MIIEESVRIAASPEVVYPVVRDLERAPQWQESLVSVDVALATEVRRFAGREVEATFEILEDDPPRRFVITSDGGRAYARATFDLNPFGDGTIVRCMLDLQLRGAARLASRVVKPAAQQESRENLQRLKELIER